jgi:hypothetical protein
MNYYDDYFQYRYGTFSEVYVMKQPSIYYVTEQNRRQGGVSRQHLRQGNDINA